MAKVAKRKITVAFTIVVPESQAATKLKVFKERITEEGAFIADAIAEGTYDGPKPKVTVTEA